ncbi:hypothetical protein A2Y68_03270 [Candidatus Woesebacteria bacterium RBG_13_46_13]|uniref:PABS domain-containing protein n=1 Tax=Candidatus Woesebacteria bacterium RBG_13_46_13 TaxID=1802479 RepID=A0A1F7X4D6_9BACT|nr:MAG: hypothetical protein A2Y68_03270 [Candidatus Woesebacteria bacterium RBG_13_46_13]
MLGIVVFVTGASVMVTEIVASRILAPYIGTSIIVWTSLIGVILGGLALGYYWGGRLADKAGSYFLLRNILFLASVYIFGVSQASGYLLTRLIEANADIRISSLVSSLTLFLPPTILLGMVIPFAVALSLKEVNKAGRVAGGLYALSTLGSILGTFWCGFFLLADIGSIKILVLISLLLILIAILLNFAAEKAKTLWFLILLSAALLFVFIAAGAKVKEEGLLLDTDTLYSRVIIKAGREPETGRETIELTKGRFIESYAYTQGDDLFGYYNYYDLASIFNPELSRVLMIGGAGFVYPKHFLKTLPKTLLDVVELDPAMLELAEEYFGFTPNPTLQVYHEDARTYLNSTQKKYDALLIDVFDSDITLPFQLTTVEVIKKYYEALTPKGVLIVNIIGQIEGEEGEFLRSEYLTYLQMFPFVELYPISDAKDGSRIQNIMLVATKNKQEEISKDARIAAMLGHRWEKTIEGKAIILTDDFAPVEQMMAKRTRWDYLY